MANNITIEKIDAIIARVPNVTYAEAKEVLCKFDGDVIESIIHLEGTRKNKAKKAVETVEDVFTRDGEHIKSQLKQLFKKSTVIRMIVEKEDKVMMNIPLTIGVIGATIAPILSLVGLSAAVLSKYSVKILNEDDGEIVNLGELNKEKLNILKDMILNTVKDTVVDRKGDCDGKDVTDDLIKELNKDNNGEE